MAQPVDVCVRGGGVVGCTLSLLLAGLRLRVGLVPAAAGQVGNAPDIRCFALNLASRQLLESVRGWPAEAAITPVRRMSVLGDAGGRVGFDAAEQGVDALAWIVEAAALESQLAEAMRFQPLVEMLPGPVDAPLTVVCEGHGSRSRDEFGIRFETMAYQQAALATRVTCEKPHGQMAWQWFSGGEVLALLPIGGPLGNSMAVVWSVNRERQAELEALDDAGLARALEVASHHALGRLEPAGPRGSWPLQMGRAEHWCGPMPGTTGGRNWVLAGDAAHQVHPLAGQGLNLGLGDARELATVLGGRNGRDDWRGVGDMKLLRRYERARKLAIAPMGMTMDGLQRMFALGTGSWSSLRNAGMNGFDRLRPLKSWVVTRAMGQTWGRT